MKLSIVAIQLALISSLAAAGAFALPAQAQNIGQSAPARSTSTPRQTVRPAAPPSGANAYFESRSRSGPQQQRMGGWHVGMHQRGLIRERLYQSAPAVGRSAAAAPPAGSVTRGGGFTQSRTTTTIPPERRRRTEPLSDRVIDARLPWAARESSGVRFGVPAEPRPIPRTRELSAPQVPYFAPQAEIRLTRLPHTNRHHRFRGIDWYAINGRWFQREPDNGYVSVIPSVGFMTPFLPDGAIEVVIDGVTYYRSRGVSYREVAGEYLVVESIASSGANRSHQEREGNGPIFYNGLSDLYAEPTRGQSENDFEADASRCIESASADSEFTPLIPGRSTERTVARERFNDFQALSRACLELAGYDIY